MVETGRFHVKPFMSVCTRENPFQPVQVLFLLDIHVKFSRASYGTEPCYKYAYSKFNCDQAAAIHCVKDVEVYICGAAQLKDTHREKAP